MYRIIDSLLIVLLYIGPCVLAVCGWPIEKNPSPVFMFYPSFYILLFLLFIKLNAINKDNKTGIFFVLFILLYFIIKAVFKIGDHNRMVLVNSMIVPILYATYFNSRALSISSYNAKKIIVNIYIINCILSIIERFTLHQFFPLNIGYNDDLAEAVLTYEDISLFRSNALLGHPLSNAIISTVVMSFILFSNYPLTKKISLYLLGLLSHLCFNARGVLAISCVFLLIYIIRYTLARKGVKVVHKFLLLLFLVIVIVIGYMAIENGLGGRLFMSDSLSEDSSFMARISIFDIFEYITLDDILMGMDREKMNSIVLLVVGMSHVENWVILSVLSVGILITIYYLLVLISYIRKYMVHLPIIDGSFFLILLMVFCASGINNCMACGVPVVPTLFVCLYAFRYDITTNE